MKNRASLRVGVGALLAGLAVWAAAPAATHAADKHRIAFLATALALPCA